MIAVIEIRKVNGTRRQATNKVKMLDAFNLWFRTFLLSIAISLKLATCCGKGKAREKERGAGGCDSDGSGCCDGGHGGCSHGQCLCEVPETRSISVQIHTCLHTYMGVVVIGVMVVLVVVVVMVVVKLVVVVVMVMVKVVVVVVTVVQNSTVVMLG